jgi:hypothetical protein
MDRGDDGVNDLMITHNYHGHRDADSHINVVFPLKRLKDLEFEEMIGWVAPSIFRSWAISSGATSIIDVWCIRAHCGGSFASTGPEEDISTRQSQGGKGYESVQK